MLPSVPTLAVSKSNNTTQNSDNTGNSSALSPQMDFAALMHNPAQPLPDGDSLPFGGNDLPLSGALLVAETSTQTSLLQDDVSLAAYGQDLTQLAHIALNAQAIDPQRSARSIALVDNPVKTVEHRTRFGGTPLAISPVPVASDRQGHTSLGAEQLTANLSAKSDELLEANTSLTDNRRIVAPSLEDTGVFDEITPRSSSTNNGPIITLASNMGSELGETSQKLTNLQGSGGQMPVGLEVTATQQLSGSAARSSTPANTTIDMSITTSLLDENWGSELRERVMWMAGQRVPGQRMQNAEIRLHPAELGPIRVQLSVQDDALQVTFSAHHLQTREAIEVAMPRLREMLHENGLSLAGSTVNDGDRSDVGKDRQTGEQGIINEDLVATEELETPPAGIVGRISSTALVDTFA